MSRCCQFVRNFQNVTSKTKMSLHQEVSIRLTFLVLALSQVQSFVLHVTPSVIDVGRTKNVSLSCQSGGKTSIESLRIMRLLKRDQPPNWQVIAEVEANKAEVISNDINAIAAGKVGALNDSFLSLTWPVASADTLGRYRCDVIGFMNSPDIVTEKTQELSISEFNMTIEELFTFVKDEDAWMANKINQTDYKVDYLKTSMDQLSLVIQDLVHTVKDFISTFNALIKNDVIQPWPEGSYGLMATSSGCPDNSSVSWETGYRKHNTESTDVNHDQVSPGNHLLPPVMEGNNVIHFFYQHFCIASNSTSNSSWPSGSYCINRYNGGCPYGFQSGSINIDEEDTNSLTSSVGTLPDGSYDSNTDSTIFYCCRSDGHADTHVDLPTDKPFYLYRYKGQCQLVTGMDVKEEFILLDTENSRNRDMYESDIHPDGQARNDTLIKLCYYSP